MRVYRVPIRQVIEFDFIVRANSTKEAQKIANSRLDSLSKTNWSTRLKSETKSIKGEIKETERDLE